MMVEPTALSCPRCDAAVAAEARFCANCGQALGDASETDQTRQTRLAAAAPSPLIDKMRAAGIHYHPDLLAKFLAAIGE